LKRLVDWRALLVAAAVTGVWVRVVVCRRGFEGFPFEWRWYPDSSPRIPERYDLLALDVGVWFLLFYGTIRGFIIMRDSRLRKGR
jgi:hypothetical protein